MRDNVIWVDFSAKRKVRGKLKRFFASIISPFKSPSYISSKNTPKKSLAKVHKSTWDRGTKNKCLETF